MSSLNLKQLKNYNDNGFIAPLDILSLQETEVIK